MPLLWLDQTYESHMSHSRTQTAPGVVVICASDNRILQILRQHICSFQAFPQVASCQGAILEAPRWFCQNSSTWHYGLLIGIKTVPKFQNTPWICLRTFCNGTCTTQLSEKNDVFSRFSKKNCLSSTPFPTTYHYFYHSMQLFPRHCLNHLCRGHTFGSFHANPVKKIEL